MDAITLLKADHVEIRDLLGQLEASTTRAVKKRRQLVAEIAAKLKAHTTIEEEIFYPAFKSAREKSDDDKMYFEALEEHRAAGDLVLSRPAQNRSGQREVQRPRQGPQGARRTSRR